MGTKHKTIWGAEVKLKDGDRALGFIDPRKGKANYEQVFKPAIKKSLQRRVDLAKNIYKGTKNLLEGAGDFLKDTQKLGRTGPMKPNLGRPPGDWMILPKKGSPAKHCASDMMHSGGWQEMRKHNSQGTIGNKPAIKHNEKMRQEIGTFKMPHSPLNQKNETKKDSLGREEAWAKWEKGYMDRTHKFKGTKYERPITPEENKAEMEAERYWFKYDEKTGQIRHKKTDDADIPIERKSSNGKDGLAPYKSISDIQKTYDDNIAYAKDQLNKGKLSQKNYDSFVEEEDAMLKDWKTRKAMESAELFSKGRGSGLFKKESRCWEGYEPTPGVKAYEPGSCRKK